MFNSILQCHENAEARFSPEKLENKPKTSPDRKISRKNTHRGVCQQSFATQDTPNPTYTRHIQPRPVSMKRDQTAVTNDQMQTIELNSEYLGVTHFQLMEAVGAQTAQHLTDKFHNKPNQTIHVISGPGKNGGDGFAAARHLASRGYRVKVTLVGKKSDVTDEAAKHQLNAILQMADTVQFESCPDSSQLKPMQSDIIIDALLGTGVKGDLHQPILDAVRTINKSKGYKISIDLPSGIDTDTGQPHKDAVKANLTLSLHRLKTGLTKNPKHTGEVAVLPIGIPSEAETYAGPGDFKILWKPRPSDSRKGDFGRLLVIGGSETFTGAPAYSGLAATKLGTDLVYVAAPWKTAETISSYSPDLIAIKLPGEHLNKDSVKPLEPFIQRADTIVLGPGIGLHEETQHAFWALVSEAEKQSKPLIIDADALKIFSQKMRKLRAPTVLTPHAGEFQLLTQTKTTMDPSIRKESAQQLALKIGATIILKGNIDIITDGNRMKLNRTGNPYMTVGGTGDVLTGLVGGLLAQHADPFQASAASAFINGLAGDLVISEAGPAITGSTLIEYIPKAIGYCIEGPPYQAIKK